MILNVDLLAVLSAPVRKLGYKNESVLASAHKILNLNGYEWILRTKRHSGFRGKFFAEVKGVYLYQRE